MILAFVAGSSKTSISGFFSAAQTSTPTFPTIVSKVKEEEKKVEGGDEEPDDFEKDERKTYVVELFPVCFHPI